MCILRKSIEFPAPETYMFILYEGKVAGKKTIILILSIVLG